jgi:hypothetical protein
MRAALLTLMVVVTGCATTTTAEGPAMPAEYKPTGEVVMIRNQATFDAWRVMNPNCNLRKRADGSWAGTLSGQTVDVNVYENRVAGVGMTFTREVKDGRLIITGQFNSQIVRFELGPDLAIARLPNQSYTFVGHSEEPGKFAWGPNAELQLKGDAAQAMPPWPQIAFALLAAR